MPSRKERKSKSLRGMRRHGRGNIKNRRGSGNRGGKGNAGLHKHKWSYVVKYDKERYGNQGFVRHVKKRELKTINLWEIENKIKRGEIKKKGDAYEFEFNGKVLGSGAISYPLILKAEKITEKAKGKIESAGGKVEELKVEKGEGNESKGGN